LRGYGVHGCNYSNLPNGQKRWRQKVDQSARSASSLWNPKDISAQRKTVTNINRLPE